MISNFATFTAIIFAFSVNIAPSMAADPPANPRTVLPPTPVHGPAGGAQPSANPRVVVHWGTFAKKATVGDCLEYAKGGMRDLGYQVQFKGRSVVIGTSDLVVAQATCVSLDGKSNLEVTVTAASPDSRAAEDARNKIRSYISSMTRID